MAIGNPVGRPLKTASGATLNKTRIFQGCFTDEKVRDIADRMYQILNDPQTTDGDFVKAFTAWSRYNLVTADVEMTANVEAESRLDTDAKQRLVEMVKNGSIFNV